MSGGRLSSLSSTSLVGNQPQLLEGTFDGDLADGADPAHVVLVVNGGGLERGPLPRSQCPPGGDEGDRDGRLQVEHPEMVFGFAFEELLAAHESDLWMSRDQDSGASAFDPGFEGAFGARRLALRVQLFGFLTEVPDVPVAVLGIEVVRHLLGLAFYRDDVVDDGRADAEDLLH